MAYIGHYLLNVFFLMPTLLRIFTLRPKGEATRGLDIRVAITGLVLSRGTHKIGLESGFSRAKHIRSI